MNLVNGNYIDLIIILVLIYFVSTAWRYGFIQLMSDFVSFLLSLLISLRLYQPISNLIQTNFNIVKSLSDAISFLFAAILIESLLGQAFYLLISKLPKKVRNSKINKYLGTVPALGEGLIFVAFILMLCIALPLRGNIKTDIMDSRIGGYIVDKTSTIERQINKILGGIIDDSLTYFTVKQGSSETVKLNSRVQKLTVDEATESQMLTLVNKERVERGIEPLTWRPEVVPVARAHAKDMWERNYFSHYSPEGKDVSDRVDSAKIKYSIVGENLALAPTLTTAHKGLMNSDGHRANILEPKFKRVGIGVIDNGIYGKMFVQVFTD